MNAFRRMFPQLILPIRGGRSYLLVATMLILVGCSSSVDLSFDYDLQQDFSGCRTYAWYDQVSAPSEVARNRIRKAVDIVLYHRGFRYVEPDAVPDFRISFTAVGEPALPADEVSSRLAYVDGAWRSPVDASAVVPKYTSGTLIIDFIEPVEGRLLWRGVGSRSLNKNRWQGQKEQDILEGVRAILEQFPPPAK